MHPTLPRQSPNWRSLQAAIRKSWPNRHRRSSDVATLVGCSGGADSVALLRLLADLWTTESTATHGSPHPIAPLVVAHCNHGLRGKDSDTDEAFVRELCDQLELPLVTHRQCEPHQPRAQRPAHDERSLRQIRREFFQQTAKQQGCRYVAVAHSADDQAETMLHHFIRGTGPLGLAGIAESADLDTDIVLRRPLLQVRRDTLRAGLREIGQSWREDASNQLNHYTRNWIRHDVLPLIQDRYPNVVEAVHRAGTLQRETNEMIRRLSDRWLRTFSEFDGDRWIIHTQRLSQSAGQAWPNNQSTAVGDWMFERPILVAASQMAWDRLGWPRGSMTMEHWQRLSNRIDARSQPTMANHEAHFPGRIILHAQNDRLLLRRE